MNRYQIAIAVSAAILAIAPTAQAQFSLDQVLNTAISEIGQAANPLAAQAAQVVQSGVKGATKGPAPAAWPTQYTYWDYSSASDIKPFNSSLVRTQPDNRNRVRWETLPFQHAIVRVRGNGKRKLVFFVDPNCPYVRQMERNLASLTDVTIYTFVAPVWQAKSLRLAQRINCTKGSNAARARAYEDWIIGDIAPQTQVINCGSGERIMVRATENMWESSTGNPVRGISPVLVARDGYVGGGGVDLDEVEKFFPL
ncbi:MAG: thioredoxin fold domain-containing protein [Castellaniella sp.]|uniref:thioredoxin fold domain-containing protein n=1 Tax=Castellaniella sp. TaxID=1955812 RepID=UPI003C712A05